MISRTDPRWRLDGDRVVDRNDALVATLAPHADREENARIIVQAPGCRRLVHRLARKLCQADPLIIAADSAIGRVICRSLHRPGRGSARTPRTTGGAR